MSVIQSYTDSSGKAHWPDATVLSEKYYGVDWDTFLTAENDTFTAVTWTVPTGLTSMVEDEVGNQARIKLSADTVGSDYEVVCTLETIEGADTQKFVQKMLISVV